MVPGMVGIMVAMEVLKWIVAGSRDVFGALIVYDGLETKFKKIKLRNKKKDCVLCSEEGR